MGLPGAHGCDLSQLGKHLVENGPRKTQPTSRRVRAFFHGMLMVDTTRAKLVWEHDFYPQYYVPFSDCLWPGAGDASATRGGKTGPVQGIQVKISLRDTKDDKLSCETDRVLRFLAGTGSLEASPARELVDMVRLEFGSMDQWLEEDVPIYVHPKDPYKRVDLLPSSRPIEVRVDGKTLAKSPYSIHLLETGLPTRYYLPLGSVDHFVLRKGDMTTKCPYKGEAEYYHVVLEGGKQLDNLVWYYRNPTLESAGIAGMVCFYNEKVDVFLDGQELERPKTHFA